MKTEEFMDRTDFLERNRAELINNMRESNITDPVGVVVDLRDFHGKQFAIAAGANEEDIERNIAECKSKSKIPTLITVITWEFAELVMPHTSPSATANLASARQLCEITGRKLAIAIMEKGNRYEIVDLS